MKESGAAAVKGNGLSRRLKFGETSENAIVKVPRSKDAGGCGFLDACRPRRPQPRSNSPRDTEATGVRCSLSVRSYAGARVPS